MNRVLAYAPMVAEGALATVHLTAEDWQVVADTLFRMQTPKEMLPEAIKAYALVDGNQAIELSTEVLTIKIEMI